ncbi:hypothetical protein HYY71_06435 [Candidatus Woesearchaeota archaeon]|nr:hypothetical protein [Candidatus Woesearchaeota archaeon]
MKKMKDYNPVLPVNYAEMQKVGIGVSNTILSRKIPQPSQINLVLGNGNVPAYFLMHALMWAIEHKRGRSIPDYKRRDKKPIQRHPFDASFRPLYRFNDTRESKIPSKYTLTPREIKAVLVHDLGEEFGQSLLGALVVNDVIGYLLGTETGKDVDLLTNKNALLLDTLEDELNRLEPSQIRHKATHGIAVRLGSRVTIRDGSVRHEYLRIQQALSRFRAYVEAYTDYVPPSEKKALIDIIDGLIVGARAKTQDRMSAKQVAERIQSQYGHIISLLESHAYVEVDTSLILPGDNEFLLTLKKTFYHDFVRRIAESVRKLAPRNGDATSNGDFLAPYVETLAETTDTVTNMDLEPPHAISIFRKAREKIKLGVDLVLELKLDDVPYEKLARAVDYLNINLVDVVKGRTEDLDRRARKETSLQPDLEIFRIMQQKMGDLEARMAQIKAPGFFDNLKLRIARVGNNLHLL